MNLTLSKLGPFNNFRRRRSNEAELTPEGPLTHVGGYSFTGTALAGVSRMLRGFEPTKRAKRSRRIAKPGVFRPMADTYGGATCEFVRLSSRKGAPFS